MSISSDEVNYLIYRYLQENGYLHSAFAFAHESLITSSTVSHVELPPGALITFLQKGLEYVGIESHIQEDGSVQEFDGNISLLSPFICDTIATKEDRRVKRSDIPAPGEEVSASGEDGKSPTIPQCSIAIRSDVDHKFLSLSGHAGEVFMCLWNPVKNQLASGSSDGMCRMWELSTVTPEQWASENGTQLSHRTAVLPHYERVGERNKDVTSVSWSPDGQYLATGCYDGVARVWDNLGNLKCTLKEHTGPVFSLKWSRKSNFVLSGSYDRRAIVWSPDTGKVEKRFQLHSAAVLDVDWKDGDIFASCSTDMTIMICSVSGDSRALATLTGHTDEVNAVCWSPGGQFIASCSDDSTAKIWNVSGLVHDLRGHLKEIYTVRWTPTGQGSPNPDKPLLLCTACFDNNVKVWSALHGSLLFNLHNQPQPVYSISSSPSGDLLASGSLGGYVTVWSLVNGSIIAEMRGEGDTFDVSWNRDGSLLSSSFSSGTLSVFDASLWLRQAQLVAAQSWRGLHGQMKPSGL